MSRSSAVALLAALLGALLWAASPALTGKPEPWDAESGYYYVGLAVAGMVTGWLGPRRFWLWPFAVWLGQAVVLLVMAVGHPEGVALAMTGWCFCYSSCRLSSWEVRRGRRCASR